MSLLRFCYAGRPKKLAFTSSITTCLGPGENSVVISEMPVGNEPSAALSTGYAQSKYISKLYSFQLVYIYIWRTTSNHLSMKKSKELPKPFHSTTPSTFLSVSCASVRSAARFELACGARPRCIPSYLQPHSTLACTASLPSLTGVLTGSPSMSRRIAYLSFSSSKNLPSRAPKENQK